MASISSLIPSLNLPNPLKISLPPQSKLFLQILPPTTNPFRNLPKNLVFNSRTKRLRFFAVAEEQTSVVTSPSSEAAARRLYIGNIPRTVNNDELTKIVEEHSAVEKAEVHPFLSFALLQSPDFVYSLIVVICKLFPSPFFPTLLLENWCWVFTV